MRPNIESVLKQLAALGVSQGDVLFVTADLLRVGLFCKSRSETARAWVELLLQAVGPGGTIIAAAYTPVFFRFKRDHQIVFTSDSSTTAGALPNALLADPRSVRSAHPTNSCVAIGREAQEIMGMHNERSLSYSVLGEIVRRRGKHLMLGTLDRKNAPLGLHYGQELMGITKREPTVDLFQTYYIDALGQKQLFTRRDVGGCSSGGYKLLAHLLVEDAASFGLVGDAPSALIDAEKCTQIAVKAMTSDRRALICDDRWCISCRGRWSVSGVMTPLVYLRKFADLRLYKRFWAALTS